MDTSKPTPRLRTSPTAAVLVSAVVKPDTVSGTNVKSLVGVSAPSCTSRLPAASWLMIVGITARADCRGPKVLNGRIVTVGRPKDAWYALTIWSAAILDAEYGDCPWSGCPSSIGTYRAVP